MLKTPGLLRLFSRVSTRCWREGVTESVSGWFMDEDLPSVVLCSSPIVMQNIISPHPRSGGGSFGGPEKGGTLTRKLYILFAVSTVHYQLSHLDYVRGVVDPHIVTTWKERVWMCFNGVISRFTVRSIALLITISSQCILTLRSTMAGLNQNNTWER